MRGVFGLLLLGGGAALAFAVGMGFDPLAAVQRWATSGGGAGSVNAVPGNPGTSEPAKPLARTSGGKAE